MSVPAASISVNPKLVDDPEGTAAHAAAVLAALDRRARQPSCCAALVAKENGFRLRAPPGRRRDRRADSRSSELDGVNVDDEDRRILPGGETGRSVIGLTDIDGNGIAGLEYQYGGGEAGRRAGYNDILTGTPGESPARSRRAAARSPAPSR